MKTARSKSKLHKQFVLSQDGYDVYAVNSLAMRNSTPNDEEFGNFATHQEFPRIIPQNEIWVADRVLEREGLFFIADALTRLQETSRGVPEETAYTTGLNVERFLRKRLCHVDYRGGRPHKRVPPRLYEEPYLTLDDSRFPVTVWIVDGSLVRSFYKTDYTEGGHGYVYAWVPKNEIWIETAVERSERPFILVHEYTEMHLMRDLGLEYDEAHEICSTVEYALRENRTVRARLMTPGGRHLTKADLHRLTRPEYFQFVESHYVKK